MASLQAQMVETLKKTGLPHREIQCYGAQIVVTVACRDTAAKWAGVLSRFATVRGTVKSVDYAKENRNTVLRPSTVDVWRVFARV